MSDWAVCTAASGPYEAMLDYGVPTLKRYAEKHGMEVVVDHPAVDFPASWYKISLMKRLLREYDGVLWVDADAMFVRYDQDIRDVVTAPWNWVHNRYTTLPWKCVPCAGVVAVQNPLGPTVLDAIWALFDQYRDHGWWEQAAAHEYFGYDGFEYLQLNLGYQGELPAQWNSTPQSPAPNPIIVHATALPTFEDRLAFMAAHA